jgi:hypothetical protein
MKAIQGALYAPIKGRFSGDKRRTKLICKPIVGLLKLPQSGLRNWSKALLPCFDKWINRKENRRIRWIADRAYKSPFTGMARCFARRFPEENGLA